MEMVPFSFMSRQILGMDGGANGSGYINLPNIEPRASSAR
jgi:hypothetical protein